MNRRHAWMRWVFGVLWLAWSWGRADAHSASTAYLQMTQTNGVLKIRLELPLRDLDDRLGLDANDDGNLTWGELRTRLEDVVAWVAPRWEMAAGERVMPLEWEALQVADHGGDGYAVLDYGGAVPPAGTPLRLRYRLLVEEDPMHRCLVRWRSASGQEWTRVMSPGQTEVEWVPEGAASVGWTEFVREGVHHIWTGYDHLLFLLALLLPGVLVRTSRGWEAVPGFRRALVEVLKVVTAFTLAHSVTLSLAALGILRPSSRWVESAIAASILVAAVGNVLPRRGWNEAGDRGRGWEPWKLALVFGLIHGFGFASVLGELGLQREHLALPLLGFNAGVELGQLACVAVFLPLAFTLRSTRFYRSFALPVGSLVIALMAGGWLVDRVFGLEFMPI